MALVISPNAQMSSIATPTAVGANQITQLIDPKMNVYGMHLLTLYTQIIQPTNPNNVARSVILAAAKAPADDTSQPNTLAIFRTFQDGNSETAVSLGGNAPAEVIDMIIPPNWGIWQVLTVAGATLSRSNVRLSYVLGSKDVYPQ